MRATAGTQLALSLGSLVLIALEFTRDTQNCRVYPRIEESMLRSGSGYWLKGSTFSCSLHTFSFYVYECFCLQACMCIICM